MWWIDIIKQFVISFSKQSRWTNKRLKDDPHFFRIFSKLSNKSSFGAAQSILDRKRKNRISSSPVQESGEDQIKVSMVTDNHEEEETDEESRSFQKQTVCNFCSSNS